ncbi:DUF3558 family protein [Gordonia sp. (in: high G+C Gram-positive bacteria)]|uniref:DUF3558 family protein n=1 Tax=Gordonia sp. (in: high G+C Gram-positive bacteria) TaxID=84139 RepID=UPI0039E3094A
MENRAATGVAFAVAVTVLLAPGCSRQNATDPAHNAPESLAHRLNPANDGTTYEPCDGPTRESLTALGWSPDSRHDAAVVDNQTARGCAWNDSHLGSVWGISQTVGNSPSLSAYKQMNSAFQWQQDQVLGDRPVGVHLIGRSTCATRVQSQRAGVSTVASYNRVPAPPTSEICARAIAFTKATIDRMPE